MNKQATLITVKKAHDMQSEKSLIENDDCDFAVSERSGILYVSTKHNEASLLDVPGFSLLYTGGIDKIKRFCMPSSKDEFIEQLRKIYPGHAIVWIE
ncbi:MAG: hypothetical protein US70_C0002G0008 [Parcubacteria group bacterium GW2011_GWD2_38_11]|nr:MAG: hypothetical protein US70_C0002G0008 [Parcubacteria group bacterium GW2011_GWD2_38_11]